MKKKSGLKIAILSLISLMSLSSCSLINAIREVLYGNGDYVYSENNISISLTITEGKAGTNALLKDVKNKQGMSIFPSTGENNLLVIPVYFSDYAPEKCFSVSREVAKENINKAFFGDASDTGWESLSSYYYKSSYGNLTIKGTVTDWCPLSNTLINYATDKTYNDPSVPILREAINWYKDNNPEADLSIYDSDKDGYLDGVVLVYANDYYSKDSANKYKTYVKNDEDKAAAIEDLCWAFTNWDTGAKSSLSSPTSQVYMFASYDFLWDGGYGTSAFFSKNYLVDSHTFVHEFGHMLGLDDYYSYDSDGTSPIGGLDMMDNNIGDHNAYSKYLLGWIEPDLVSDIGSYSLEPLSEKPSAILVPADKDNFGYSAFDEYLLVEFYAPTELNYQDAKDPYCGTYPRMFSSYGIRIYHVDSRLVIFDRLHRTYSYSKIVPELTSSQNLSFYASNTPSESCDGESRLITLLSRDGIDDYYASRSHASNVDLFIKGTSLDSYEFHNGGKLNYKISVDKIDTTNKQAIISLNEK